MANVLEIEPRAAQARLTIENKEVARRAVLIDVREPEEVALVHLKGAHLLPMGGIPAELPRLEALADEADLLVLCHHGVRSLQVVAWLRANGVERCYSVAGGIDRWSRELDPKLPRY
jgi:rhodanese-related sulfurtransferase